VALEGIARLDHVEAHDGCDTILSIYNPAKYCSAHGNPAQNARRLRPARITRTATCEHCGVPFETANANRMYCSDRCRMAAFSRRKRVAQRAARRLEQQTAEVSACEEAQLVAGAP
jgi:endogenous inhibitor of DNA gyrase (YacG/DUF329 family)